MNKVPSLPFEGSVKIIHIENTYKRKVVCGIIQVKPNFSKVLRSTLRKSGSLHWGRVHEVVFEEWVQIGPLGKAFQAQN